MNGMYKYFTDSISHFDLFIADICYTCCNSCKFTYRLNAILSGPLIMKIIKQLGGKGYKEKYFTYCSKFWRIYSFHVKNKKEQNFPPSFILEYDFIGLINHMLSWKNLFSEIETYFSRMFLKSNQRINK